MVKVFAQAMDSLKKLRQQVSLSEPSKDIKKLIMAGSEIFKAWYPLIQKSMSH
jgi:hypothetical protein